MVHGAFPGFLHEFMLLPCLQSQVQDVDGAYEDEDCPKDKEGFIQLSLGLSGRWIERLVKGLITLKRLILALLFQNIFELFQVCCAHLSACHERVEVLLVDIVFN